MPRAAPAPLVPPGTGEFSGILVYTVGEYRVVLYALAVAGLALLAGFGYALMTRGEVAPRYRAAADANVLVQGVAFLSYLALFLSWQTSFRLVGGVYAPVEGSLFEGGLRYADWSVTVPLLAVELLAVCAVAGREAFRARAVAVAAAFLMIVTGFLGAQVLDSGRRVLWLVVWGLISTVFFLVLYVVLGRAVLAARKEMGPTASRTLLNATILLFGVFGAYPLIYLIQQSVGPGSNLVAWALVTQLGLGAADITAKVGFGLMIHKVAKLRTAEDVAAGAGTHPEEVWISQVKHADAWPPVAAALAGHGAHTVTVRTRPDGDSDTAAAPGPGETGTRRGRRFRR